MRTLYPQCKLHLFFVVVVLVLVDLNSNINISSIPYILNVNQNAHIVVHWLTTINHQFKPQNIIKKQQDPPNQHKKTIISSMRNNININININIHNNLFSILSLLLFLYIFIECMITTTASPPTSISDAMQLINAGNTLQGELCHNKLNNSCNFFPNWSRNTNTGRQFIQCPDETICFLKCEGASSCKDLDIFAGIDSMVLIDCIATASCHDLSVQAKDAYYLYIEGNQPHSIIESQIQCPINNTPTNTTCVVHGSCTDYKGDTHCDNSSILPITTPIIDHLSIYSYHGYNGLQLQCDPDPSITTCFEDSFILCGDVQSQQTCWIEYNSIYNQYICTGDDIGANSLKCRDIINIQNDADNIYHISSTLTLINSSNSIKNTSSSAIDPDSAGITKSDGTLDGMINDIIKKKEFAGYLALILTILICACCILGIAACKCSARDRKKNKNKKKFEEAVFRASKHRKGGKKWFRKCTKKSCLCYYLSCCCCCYCCYCLWSKSESSQSKIGGNKNNGYNKNKNKNKKKNKKEIEEEEDTETTQQHQITVITDDNDNDNEPPTTPQTVNPLHFDNNKNGKKGGNGGVGTVRFPFFGKKNGGGSHKNGKRIITPSNSRENTMNTINTTQANGVELVVMNGLNGNNNNNNNNNEHNNTLHPTQYRSNIDFVTTYNMNMNVKPNMQPIQQQRSQSTSGQHTNHTNPNRKTFSDVSFDRNDSNNTHNGSGENNHNKRASCSHLSHRSHHDGLEDQAAKKLYQTKLGTNTAGNIKNSNNNNNNTPNGGDNNNNNNNNNNNTRYSPLCNTTYTTDFDINPTAFGVLPQNNNDTMDEDYKFALQLQQQQLFEAVEGTKYIKSIKKKNNNIKTPCYDNNNGNTPYHTRKQEMDTDIGNTPNITHRDTIETPEDTTGDGNDDTIEVLDMGGGFKIGMAEESSISHTSRTDGDDTVTTSSQFDPEDPHHVQAEDEYYHSY